MTVDRPISAEEFVAIAAADHPRELVRGRVSDMMHPSALHGKTVVRLAYALEHYMESAKLGAVFADTGFVTERGPDSVRGPDVAFVRRERAESLPAGAPWFEGSPDLAIEVRSPSETFASLVRKADEYLAGGAEMVWIVDPDRRRVHTVEAGKEPTLIEGATVSGGRLLPGFELSLARLFRP